MKAWLATGEGVIAKTGFPGGLDRDGLIRGFVAHNEAVKQAIPANQLLVYEVNEEWGPLCQFLAYRCRRKRFHGPTIARNSGTA
jgi:hypothetical protein